MKAKSAAILAIICLAVAACHCRNSSAIAEKDAETDTSAIEEAVPSEKDSFISSAIPDSVRARMMGRSYHEGALISMDDLRYLKVLYNDFSGATEEGEIVCNKAIADDLIGIFRELYRNGYQIRSIRLVDDFGGSDEESMKADNTSCFNYRAATGQKKLSVHAMGLAIDINPLENPFVRRGKVDPAEAEEYADRSKDFPHKIDKDDLCYRLFREKGFQWGGSWASSQDYQHFEKPSASQE